MNGYERLEFKLGEYLLKGIERKFKKEFSEARFKDDIARTNTAQIAPKKCLTAARRAGIGAVKKATTRANIGGAGGKALQCRNCKGDGDATKRIFI